MTNTFIGEDDERHWVTRFTATLAGGMPAPVAECGLYGRQGQLTLAGQPVTCEACKSAHEAWARH